MSQITFKKFVNYVDLEGDVSDEQINEIFGLFRNNQKLDALKKKRAELKTKSAAQKADLDKALADFRDGKKPTPKGQIALRDLEDALSSDDRKALAKHDTAERRREMAYSRAAAMESLDEAKNTTVKAFKLNIPKDVPDDKIHEFVEDQAIVTIEGFERKGDVVYFYPHFEHDYSPDMARALASAWNRFDA
jgi:hypothetical protein